VRRGGELAKQFEPATRTSKEGGRPTLSRKAAANGAGAYNRGFRLGRCTPGLMTQLKSASDASPELQEHELQGEG